MTGIIPAFSFTTPIHDKRFLRLPEEVRQFVKARLSAMQKIYHAENIEAALNELAANRRGQRGWAADTLRNVFYRFKQLSGDWTAVLDKARAGAAWWGEDEDGNDLSHAFREYLGSLRSRRQRGKFRAAYAEKLIPQWRRWRAGDATAAIPGYQTCPEANPLTDLPFGWSEGNLRRIARKEASIAARKLINIGPHAAQDFTYKVPKTREGVEPGQIIFPDDCWNDFRVLYKGSGSRIISLHMLDLASGCNVIRGHKPTTTDERGVEERLKEREMVFLLDFYFATVGYHPTGTRILCEKSTATVRPLDENALDDLSGGKITVKRGPKGGGPGLSALFTGPGGGNPNWKAPLESWFNLLHNRCDDMLDFPGQTGKNSRLDKPEGLELMERADEAMHRAMQILTPDRQKQIRFNLLQYEQAAPAIDAMCEFINTRRDHKLNNWADCGNYIPAFRLNKTTPWFPWNALEQLTPDQQEHVRTLLASDPELTGEICLSPREVFDKGAAKLKRFNPAQRAMLLANVEGQEYTVKRGLLELTLPEVNPRATVPYGPILRDFDGTEIPLANDAKYLTRVNNFDPRRVWLYDAKGGFIGVSEARFHAAHYDAPAELDVHHRAKARHFAPVLAQARQLAVPITARANEIIDSNAAVFADQEREETAVDRRLDRRARKAKTDFTALGGETPGPKPPGVSMQELSQL